MDKLKELVEITEELGGYDGDTVEELRITCAQLRQQIKKMHVTIEALYKRADNAEADLERYLYSK